MVNYLKMKNFKTIIWNLIFSLLLVKMEVIIHLFNLNLILFKQFHHLIIQILIIIIIIF